MKEIQSIKFCSVLFWKLLKKSLTELTAIVASLPVLRSFLVTDTTQQPQPPSRHITFVPTSYIKKHYQWRMQGRDPAPRVTCRQKWNECGQQEFFFRPPPSPTPCPYLQVSLHEVPFPEFPSHSHRILVSSILLGWNFTNHHIISSWSISMVKWIWSKVSPKHF